MSQVNPLSNNDPATLDGLEKVFTDNHGDTTDDVDGFHTGSRDEVLSSELFTKGLESVYTAGDTIGESSESNPPASKNASRPRNRKRASGEYMGRSKVLDEIEKIRLEIKPACIPWPDDDDDESDSTDITTTAARASAPPIAESVQASDNSPTLQDFSPPPATSHEYLSSVAIPASPIEDSSFIAPHPVDAPATGEPPVNKSEVNPDDQQKANTKKPRQPTSSFLKDLIEKSSKHLRQAADRGTAVTTVEASFIDEFDMVSRSDLIGILDSFIGMLQRGGNPSEQLKMAPVERQQPVPVTTEIELTASVEDKTEELEEMRRLVIEAQETIIKLLTDRVEDRAKIATLETELKFLPDLQAQADRAMAVAFRTEEFRSDIHKIKYELEHYRIAN
ncbi:MAG: hypothetical protein K2Z81_08550, partial [Cyanobacteria bacterium]|nr:hypothetical protein [Cyanobacteriota bacterium]